MDGKKGEPMNDLIRRKDVLKIIKDRTYDLHSPIQQRLMLNAIKNIPTAEPKVGEWINDTNYSGWTCTNCDYHDGNATDNYCPNCGAKMERSDNGDTN